MSGFEIEADSSEATGLAGKLLGSLLAPGDCLALTGELGAGKTHLTKGIASGLGVAARVVSPSFNLLLEYPGRIPLRHLDAYFASREAALLDEACGEVFGGDGVAVVEWAERIEPYLPADRLQIRLVILGEQRRRFRIVGLGERGNALERGWKELLRANRFKIREDWGASP